MGASVQLKRVDGWPGYEVSSTGHVWSDKTRKWLKPNISKTGYASVELFKNGKSKRLSIHRLVAQAFIPNEKHLPCVNHKNEVRNDNRASNLEWCTHKYNSNYGNCRAKIKANRNMSKEQLQKFWTAGAMANAKKVMNVTTGKCFDSVIEAARFYNVNASHISETCKHKRKSAGGYSWKYWR